MNKKIGFIGSGNMAGAIIGGLLKSGLASREDLMAADVSEVMRKKVSDAWQIRTTADNLEVVAASDILFLAVKPNIYPAVIAQIREAVKPETVVVTIAAGQTLEKVGGLFGRDVKIVRVMPNTPALVGEGMAALCPNPLVTKEELEDVLAIFGSIGRAEVVGEYLMDVVTAVSGSSPAYVYMFIEAMADAAVAGGMPRAQAYEFCAQAVLGSAKMVLETGKHPGELKDLVCSPGGTTIAAVCELERLGMRSAVMSAVAACIEKSREL